MRPILIVESRELSRSSNALLFFRNGIKTKHLAIRHVCLACKVMEHPEAVSKNGIGAIGIDLHADHVACVETDRYLK